MMEGCQFVGADQDPLRDYPLKYCGAKTLTGKYYCADHYHRIYQKGTSVNGKRAARAIDDEIKALAAQQEIEEMEAYDG